MSGAVARVVASIATHITPKWSVRHTAVAAARKPSRQGSKARAPRGASCRKYPTL